MQYPYPGQSPVSQRITQMIQDQMKKMSLTHTETLVRGAVEVQKMKTAYTNFVGETTHGVETLEIKRERNERGRYRIELKGESDELQKTNSDGTHNIMLKNIMISVPNPEGGYNTTVSRQPNLYKHHGVSRNVTALSIEGNAQSMYSAFVDMGYAATSLNNSIGGTINISSKLVSESPSTSTNDIVVPPPANVLPTAITNTKDIPTTSQSVLYTGILDHAKVNEHTAELNARANKDFKDGKITKDQLYKLYDKYQSESLQQHNYIDSVKSTQANISW